MAKILILESLSEGADDIDYATLIHFHAQDIASICLLSDIPDSAMVVAVNPIFYGMIQTLWGQLYER